ncbi:uncharacterized protein N7477_000223 [Penicillium maclennaniae]|uniref:uncharacterized protein n=1 Tax=Penicillium maclennaniae TaxID=1343394 RepID=UPI002540FC61|nr:uncharacterized protein N7477_000223 [Penicillium maclennaniae]KAJ5683878.1 hypothetical protein N7477_000223 [Penicillium maclennaniae]
MLTASGEFEHATLSFLTASVEPEKARSTLYNVLFMEGAACVVVGAVVSFGAWWVAWTATSYCAGGVAIAGVIATPFGIFDPNRRIRTLIEKVQFSPLSLRRAFLQRSHSDVLY